MKILFVTPDPPFPPTDGARLVVAHLARELARTHTLYLAALTDGSAIDPENEHYFAETRLVRRKVPAKWRKWGTSLLDDLPLWARVNDSPALRAGIRELLADHAIDVAHLDTGLMAIYLEAVAPVPAVLAPHDSLTRVLAHRKTLAARLQYGKMKRFESTAYARARRVIVVTEQEKEYLQSFAPRLPLCVIPNGIDTDYYFPLPGREAPLHIGFHGVMDYDENVMAVLYFVREVLPQIRQVLPGVVFTIIGRSPVPVVSALAADPQIRVTGTVDDVRPWIAAQALMVVPMPVAGGIKNKLLEAMAMGKAVVASPQAAEGLDARAGEEFVMARTPREWVETCIHLLGDDAARAQLGARARARALEHTWQAAASAYAAVYREAMDAAAVR